MNEMNILTLNGEQYEVADKVAREGKLDKEPIPMATDKDTQAVRRKPDGSLWTKAGGGGGAGGAVDSVNGRTGDVILKLGDLDGDATHRTVTDSEKTEWNGKLDKATIGEAKLTDTQEVHLTPEGKLVTRPTGGGGGGAVDSVNGKTGDVFLKLRDLDSDISHRTVTDTQIVGWDNKQDAGDYATTADLDGKLDKSPIGAATPDDTQEVHLTPEGKLVTAPGGGGGGGIPVTLTAITNPGATVTTTDGVTTLTQEAPEGTAKFRLPNAGEWTTTATLGDKSSVSKNNILADYSANVPIVSKVLNENSWADIHEVSANGEAQNYWSVGDTKQIIINGKVGNTTFNNLAIDVFIIGFNHNAELEGNNLIHFQIGKIGGKDIALCDSKYNTTQPGNGWFNWNPNGTNKGGWEESYRRKTLYGNTSKPENPLPECLIAALPPDLRAAIHPVTKYSDNSGNNSDLSTNITLTTDYLWDLAEFEVQGSRTYANQYEQGKQQQYQYYKAGNSKVAYKHDSTASAVRWGLRSSLYYSDIAFCNVNTDGSADRSAASYSYGLRPGFAV